MFCQSIFILFLFINISFLVFPNKINKYNCFVFEDDNSRIHFKVSDNSDSFNIDSITGAVKNSGWNNSLLKIYHRYLINSEINIENELAELKQFKPSFQRSFLISLVLKRKHAFKDMYDSLAVYLNPPEDYNAKYLPFYDELVFAASASNQLSFLESSIEENDSRYLKGLISFSRGKYKKAAGHFESLLKYDSLNFEILYHISYSYRNLGEYDKALNALAKAAKIDDWKQTKKFLAMGSLFFLSNNYSNAGEFYQKALKLSQMIGNKRGEAKAVINLSILNDIYGEIESARNGFENAANIAKVIDDIEILALAYSELGVSYSFTNELVNAKKNYVKSFELYSKIGGISRLALLANNLGKVFMRIFDYGSALNYYKKGIEFSGENKRAKALNLMGLADVYVNLSNYSKALQFYNEAKEISSQINEISVEADIDYGLGLLNLNLGRYSSALSYFTHAKELSKKSNAYLTSEICNQMGLVYFKLDSLQKAGEYFNNSLRIGAELNDSYIKALSYINLALLNEKENNSKAALNFIHKSKSIANENDFDYLLGRSYLVEGNLNKDDFKSAKKSYENALRIGAQLNEFNTQIEAYCFLAQLFDKNNLDKDAESYYESAVKLIEDVSQPLFSKNRIQIAYNSSMKNIYDSFTDFYLDKGNYKKAFELIDGSRSRNTMTNLINLKLQSLIRDDSLLNRIYDYQWMLHSGIYEKEIIDSVKKEFFLMKSALIEKHPSLNKYLSTDERLSFEEIQGRISEEENLISIYINESGTFVFLINKNTFHHFKLNISPDEIKQLVTAISPYFSYTDTPEKIFYNQDLFAFNAHAAHDLYSKLLKKPLEKIRKNEKIIFSLPSELITLPFEFLVTKFNNNKSAFDYDSQNYLVFHYNISYTPSLSIFIRQKQIDLDNNNSVLLVGNPLINNELKNYSERRGLLEQAGGIPRNFGFLPLRYSGSEIKQISRIINADKILTGDDATETKFKKNAARSKVIHLATHSFIFDKQPVIFFSNFYDPNNDGFLESGEIVKLNLNSELVVLSSCSSGLGVIDESEGILGMTKAFFDAGAKSIIVSYWEVNDKYTSRLMELFYKNLSEGYDKSEALRRAKIEFIKTYSANPYYWAAFTLNGDVSEISLASNYSAIPLIYIIILIFAASSVIVYRRKFSN